VRILVVAMSHSVHTARWTELLANQGWDVHLFASGEAPHELAGPSSSLRGVTVYGPHARRPERVDPSVRMRGVWPLKRMPPVVGGLFELSSSVSLALLIRWLKPDVVHSLETQHSAYLTLGARERLGGSFPPWIVSTWGSDLFVYGRLPEHHDRLRAVMDGCDMLICDCARDVQLARGLGYAGDAAIWPANGGFDVEALQRFRQPGRPSERRLILLKGYQWWFGRGLVGVRALELCADALRDHPVAIHLADGAVELAARLAARDTGLPIEIVPFGPHERILELQGRARASIGLSISDGTPLSMLEAMALGALPIQSGTSAVGEWTVDGESALVVHHDDPAAVAAAIERAVADDELVDRAAEANAETIRERADRARIRSEVVAMYERVASGGATRMVAP